MNGIFNPVYGIELIYTQKCNIRCEHCITEAGQDKNGKLDLNKVLSLIHDSVESGINTVGITGGEPLLFFDEMIEIISVAKKHGMESKLVSNGFWGSTKEKAEEMVSILSNAGLNYLNISLDEFHLKFIPEKNILNISDAVKKQKNLALILRICCTKDYSVLDFIKRNKDYLKEINCNKPFLIAFQPLVPVGRALYNLSKKKYVTKKQICKEKCPFLGKPTVNYDGKVFVCCGCFEAENTSFNVADFNSDSPKKILELYQRDPFIFYQRTKGPYFLVKLAEKRKLKKKYKTKRILDKYVGICDYCMVNLGCYSKKDMNAMLLKEFEKDKKSQKLAEKDLKNVK